MSATSGGHSGISGILEAIPGYRGYRDKEDRRDADRRVRERVAAGFATQADRVDRVAGELATKRRIHDVGPASDFAQKIRHLVDRIATATYGYGGLFSDRNVDDVALDQLRRFDEGLMAGVDQLNGPISALEQALAAGTDLAGPARDGVAVVDKLLARLKLRDDVIETGRPVPEEKIQDVLSPKPPEASTPPPAFDMHDGDALGVLGDNFVVDARIDLAAGEHALRLFRIDVAPETWLAVPARRGESFARLVTSSETYTSGPQSSIGKTAYIVNWSSAGTGALIGKGGKTGPRPATVSSLTGQADTADRAVVIDWGNEQQVLVGKEVHPDDVELYGTTRT